MKDLPLLVVSIAMFLCGVVIGADERGELNLAVAALVADNAELRATSRQMRQRCPARPRFQRRAHTPGEFA